MFYTPDCCRFGTISEVMENSNVFEFRCFSPKSELHWVRQGNSGKGTAVLLEEEKGERLNIEGTKYWGTEDHYLLWGSCLESNKPKSVLFEYRIGRLEIPCEIPKGERAYLHFREIFVEDKYGNLTFYTELLRDIGGLS